ncbi:MAG: hypothetical protein KF902_12720 [Phycisphaeraceae bacterium]|nr:hypothetical protein [Phycisphaeraceae bacterium]
MLLIRLLVPMICVLLASVLLAGCASQTKPTHVPVRGTDYPTDFALSVTVMTPGRETDERGRDLTFGKDLAERPARYIVEPDGLLRAAVGAGATTRVYPPRTKYLTDLQMADLWRRLSWVRPELQIGDPGEDTVIRMSSTSAIIHISADGRRTTRVVNLEEDEWAKSLVRTLGEHAWLSTGWSW